jgi:hypothetical protein
MDRRHFATCALALAIGCKRAPTAIHADPQPPLDVKVDAPKAMQEILASNLEWPEYLFVEKDAVLVVLRLGGDRIVELPKRGGVPRTVVPAISGARYIWAVSADATHVDFIDGKTETVHAVDRTTGADTVIGTAKCRSSRSCFVFADDEGVIWNGPSVMGTAIPPILVDAEEGLVVLHDSVVALSGDAVRRVDRKSHAMTVVANGFDNAVLVTANARTVAYVVDDERGIRLVGEGARTVLGDAWIEQAVMNQRNLYVIGHRGLEVEDGSRTLWRVPIVAGEPTPMADVRGETAAVALDDVFVYWIDSTEPDDGRLSRLPL